MRVLPFLLGFSLLGPSIAACAAAPPNLDQQFDQTVKPFIGKYCVSCHSGKNAPAQFDLKSYSNIGMVEEDFARWVLLSQRLQNQEMPPKPMPAPPAAEVRQIVNWVSAVRADEIRRSAGDPGVVLTRRLSNAEYDYTIRDLTGEDMRVAREFPVDLADQAGFDNSGESLTMSPVLLNKYLKAAREIADHAVFTPDGIDFAPYPMKVETDRDKYSIQRILDFYNTCDKAAPSGNRMSKQVLITRGAGFVGSHLADGLLRGGHRVRVLDELNAQGHPTVRRPIFCILRRIPARKCSACWVRNSPWMPYRSHLNTDVLST